MGYDPLKEAQKALNKEMKEDKKPSKFVSVLKKAVGLGIIGVTAGLVVLKGGPFVEDIWGKNEAPETTDTTGDANNQTHEKPTETPNTTIPSNPDVNQNKGEPSVDNPTNVVFDDTNAVELINTNLCENFLDCSPKLKQLKDNYTIEDLKLVSMDFDIDTILADVELKDKEGNSEVVRYAIDMVSDKKLGDFKDQMQQVLTDTINGEIDTEEEKQNAEDTLNQSYKLLSTKAYKRDIIDLELDVHSETNLIRSEFKKEVENGVLQGKDIYLYQTIVNSGTENVQVYTYQLDQEIEKNQAYVAEELTKVMNGQASELFVEGTIEISQSIFNLENLNEQSDELNKS